jgi:hypothetical protein
MADRRENDRERDREQDRERGDYAPRGDWGRQGSWGAYGNRPAYHVEETESDFGGARSGRTNLYGTGGGGFGSGFSSYGAATGPYTGGMGSYAGRGPKNWKRSDERIREDVNERLTDHPHIDASEIEVAVNQCEVTLTGTVEDRQAKRLAEDIANSVSGVKDVHNQIRIGTQTPNR